SMRLVLDARTAAFAALIDYAGLFPPASLDMDDAVVAYRRALASPQSWVAGRFLCRASQLTDLAASATASLVAGDQPWEIGVIFDLPPGESAALATDFHAEMDPVMTVAAAEARLDEPTAVRVGALLDAILAIAPDVVPFVEVDRSASLRDQVELITDGLEQRHRVGGAKIRCGGVSPDLVPTPGEVAEFIMAATTRSLPFKATAGLHQPIRHFDEELGVERHGFVNLLMASTFAASGMDRAVLEAVIAEVDPDAFAISTAFASWRDHEVPGSALRRTRQSGFVSYGSCDFDEPVEALRALGFIGEGS
ncbi:MAG: hypothetical protein QGM49_07290, partial [Actinomycetota bacterium]|nr:hypothetical protein [Actinomycetota bacterium]